MIAMRVDEDDHQIVKNRRVSGWNFNEDALLSPVLYPKDEDEEEKESDNSKNVVVKEEKEIGGNELVPKLVYLLGSLDMQRGMVMNVLAYCGGVGENNNNNNNKSSVMLSEEGLREKREKEMVGFVGRLQRSVDELRGELKREMMKNACLEEELENLKKRTTTTTTT